MYATQMNKRRGCCCSTIIYTPPKTNMEPQNWCFVSMFLLFLSGVFSGEPCLFSGVYIGVSKNRGILPPKMDGL